ncbi:unnamed protein product [Periconia digitata]|uniref:Uncharacterized protein n=1 Tax=Periconia digitata TaxID=1303443 RepID=A0A9W4UKT5_9PLEO|nr:unnamed protein product [Periconia digitata]
MPIAIYVSFPLKLTLGPTGITYHLTVCRPPCAAMNTPHCTTNLRLDSHSFAHLPHFSHSGLSQASCTAGH